MVDSPNLQLQLVQQEKKKEPKVQCKNWQYKKKKTKTETKTKTKHTNKQIMQCTFSQKKFPVQLTLSQEQQLHSIPADLPVVPRTAAAFPVQLTFPLSQEQQLHFPYLLLVIKL